LPAIVGSSTWQTAHVDTMARSLHIGAAWVLPDWVLSAESDFPLGYTAPVVWSGGAAYSLWNLVTLRAGIQRNYMTGGLGLRAGGLRLDYAYTAASPERYGDTARLSLAFAWAL
jgi:hypothetical protein